MNRFPSIEQLKSSKCSPLNPQLFEETAPAQKRAKFGNTATIVEGERIHSKGEAKRYRQLRIAMKAGKIGFLGRQIEFELNPGGSHSVIYRADFYYQDMETGNKYVEDFKGAPETAVFKKKAKLLKRLYGIEIKITK